MDAIPFKLRKFFTKHISRSSLLGICFSDSENWAWQEIIDSADQESKSLWKQSFTTKVSSNPLLQSEIAKQYSQLTPKNISLFAGACESTYHVMRTLINPHDHVIVISPYYQFLGEIPRMCGADVEEIPLLREDNFQLNIDFLKKAIRPNTKLIVLNYPHNPTGKLLTFSEMQDLIALARFHGIFLFNDEVYRGLEFDPQNRLPSLADAYEKGIAVSSLSKIFGLPGLKVGWVASQSIPILQQAANYRNYTSIRNSELSELMALMVLRGQKELLKRNLNIILENMETLSLFFKRHPQSLSWVPPQAGTLAFPKLLLPIPIDSFVEEFIKETKVILVPASIFGVRENAFRITFGKKEMPQSLSLLEAFLIKKEKAL